MKDNIDFQRAPFAVAVLIVTLGVSAAGDWSGGGLSAPAAPSSVADSGALGGAPQSAPIAATPEKAMIASVVAEPDPAQVEAVRRDLEEAFTAYQSAIAVEGGTERAFELVAAETDIGLVSCRTSDRSM